MIIPYGDEAEEFSPEQRLCVAVLCDAFVVYWAGRWMWKHRTNDYYGTVEWWRGVRPEAGLSLRFICDALHLDMEETRRIAYAPTFEERVAVMALVKRLWGGSGENPKRRSWKQQIGIYASTEREASGSGDYQC